ncbi:MAG: SoxR reducing system RseC family protein [Desulfarculaceae bacterium]|nr:SoxR reducing system RseC family protein [Desulfarculaceae bacterium]
MNTNPRESTTRGLVLSVTDDGWAQVAADRKKGCDGCGEAKSTCHSCLTTTRRTARALNKAGAKAGDIVLLSMDSSVVFKYAALVYFIPVLGLMIGALAGFKLGAGLPVSADASTILFGIGGLAAGFFVLTVISKRIGSGKYSGPVIRNVVMEGKKGG